MSNHDARSTTVEIGAFSDECRTVLNRFKAVKKKVSKVEFLRYEANEGHFITVAQIYGAKRGMGFSLKNSCDPDRPQVGMAVAFRRALEDAGYKHKEPKKEKKAS